MNNNHYSEDFAPFKALGLPLKAVRDKARDAGKPVPNNDSGTEFCLPYHVLGFCWDNCGRKEDHRKHSSREHGRCLGWCRECYREGGPQ